MVASSISQQDARNTPVSACMAESLDDYELALCQFQSYFGDPTVTLEKTLQRDPEFVVGLLIGLLIIALRSTAGGIWRCTEDQSLLVASMWLNVQLSLYR